MINELVARVFVTRNMVHLAHWRTKSYAQHVALGDLYDTLIEEIDGIVELHQGMFGLIKLPEIPVSPFTSDIIKHLEADCKWICDNQKAICQGVSAISNQIDNLTGKYMLTLYKLKNLS